MADHCCPGMKELLETQQVEIKISYTDDKKLHVIGIFLPATKRALAMLINYCPCCGIATRSEINNG